MQHGYRLTPDAQSDLLEIRDYTIRQWGSVQARQYLAELRETMQLLTRSPNIGKERSEVGAGVQSFPHGSHMIYYFIEPQGLAVFGVLHKRMVPEEHLASRLID